jgi:hypothetical protein
MFRLSRNGGNKATDWQRDSIVEKVSKKRKENTYNDLSKLQSKSTGRFQVLPKLWSSGRRTKGLLSGMRQRNGGKLVGVSALWPKVQQPVSVCPESTKHGLRAETRVSSRQRFRSSVRRPLRKTPQAKRISGQSILVLNFESCHQ